MRLEIGIIVMQDRFPLLSLAQLKGDFTGWLHRCLVCINKAAVCDGLKAACAVVFFSPSTSQLVLSLEKGTPSSSTWGACSPNAKAQETGRAIHVLVSVRKESVCTISILEVGLLRQGTFLPELIGSFYVAGGMSALDAYCKQCSGFNSLGKEI